MRKLYAGVVRHRNVILFSFLAAFAVCLFLRQEVAVNYDINDYLPEDSPSTAAIDLMEEEFDGGIPNARVMISDVTIAEALTYKEILSSVEGVSSVTWLDDSADLTVPLETLDPDTVETYYKDGNALFTLVIQEDCRIQAVSSIRSIIGDENAMTGSAVSTALSTETTVDEIQKITVIAVLFVLLVLILTTGSFAEPFLVLGGLGIAIILNNGTNLIFGEISFVTNAAGSILQLAVSLDYSVFLIHRFEECREGGSDPQEAMVEALCKSTSSILSSGLTTVIGFFALIFMRFRLGPDLGLALAKGIAISLLTVFFFMPTLILAFYRLLDRTRHPAFFPSFRKFGVLVRRIRIPLVILFLLILVPSYLASSANNYYYGSSQIFGSGTQYGRDTEAIEEVFGKSDTYVLLVPSGDTATETELSSRLHELPQVTDILSYVDLAGAEIPTEYLDEDTLSQLISEHYSRMVLSVRADMEGEETFSLVEEIRETAEKYYPGQYALAGEGVSTYDLMDTITEDMVSVNLVSIGAVFVVLILTLRSLVVPALLVLSIEAAIWLNLSCPYFAGDTIFYIAYLIISSIQLGATVDYAILMTDRYKENREKYNKKESAIQTVSDTAISILTSGTVLTAVGLLLGYFSSNQLLSQLGIFIGRGALFSLAIVLFVLPSLLSLFDWFVTKKKKTKISDSERKGGFQK